jgi:hypothetical protein
MTRTPQLTPTHAEGGETNMATKTQKDAPKTYTPKQLSEELDIDAKRIRAFLRGTEDTARPSEAKNTSWQLTEAQAQLVRERFTTSDEDEGEE